MKFETCCEGSLALLESVTEDFPTTVVPDADAWEAARTLSFAERAKRGALRIMFSECSDDMEAMGALRSHIWAAAQLCRPFRLSDEDAALFVTQGGEDEDARMHDSDQILAYSGRWDLIKDKGYLDPSKFHPSQVNLRLVALLRSGDEKRLTAFLEAGIPLRINYDFFADPGLNNSNYYYPVILERLEAIPIRCDNRLVWRLALASGSPAMLDVVANHISPPKSWPIELFVTAEGIQWAANRFPASFQSWLPLETLLAAPVGLLIVRESLPFLLPYLPPGPLPLNLMRLAADKGVLEKLKPLLTSLEDLLALTQMAEVDLATRVFAFSLLSDEMRQASFLDQHNLQIVAALAQDKRLPLAPAFPLLVVLDMCRFRSNRSLALLKSYMTCHQLSLTSAHWHLLGTGGPALIGWALSQGLVPHQDDVMAWLRSTPVPDDVFQTALFSLPIMLEIPLLTRTLYEVDNLSALNIVLSHLGDEEATVIRRDLLKRSIKDLKLSASKSLLRGLELSLDELNAVRDEILFVETPSFAKILRLIDLWRLVVKHRATKHTPTQGAQFLLCCFYPPSATPESQAEVSLIDLGDVLSMPAGNVAYLKFPVDRGRLADDLEKLPLTPFMHQVRSFLYYQGFGNKPPRKS